MENTKVMETMETVVNEEVMETAAEVVVSSGLGKGTKIAIGAAVLVGAGVAIKKGVPKVKEYLAEKKERKAAAKKFKDEEVNEVVDVENFEDIKDEE